MFLDGYGDRSVWHRSFIRYQILITSSMMMADRDPGLDTLLDLHGQTLFVDEVGHWVKFIVLRTEVTPERPHGLSYSLTLHARTAPGWSASTMRTR